MFLLTAMPKAVSCSAILRVVRLLHFTPEIGSPAVSCRISSSIWEMTSGVFFRRRAAAAGFAYAVSRQVLFEQLAPAPGNRVRVHADELGNSLIPAVAQFERLQSCVQAPLLFIQQAGEQNNRCL